MHPRLAVNNLSTATWSLEQDVELYSTLGVNAIGLYWDKLKAIGIDRGIGLITAAGLRTVNLFARTTTVHDPRRWPDEHAEMRAVIEAASRLGAPLVAITIGAAGPLSWEDATDALGRWLEPVLPVAGEHGVTLAIEQTMPVRVEVGWVHSLRDSIDVARRLGVGAVLESNYCFNERGIDGLIADNADVIATVQLADLVPPSTVVPDRAVPGDGVIPIERLVRTAVTAGFTGPFELEMLGPRIEAEGYEPALRRALAYLDPILTAAGA